MKYDTNFKIEYCHEKFGINTNYRYFYYRIKPSELPFWKRWFFNPWRKVFQAFEWLDGYGYLFNPQEFRDKLLPLKTFGDMCRYLEKQEQIVQDRLWERVQKGEAWPDEY